MYGGVSLAIYINGVAQELLNMVRATATVPTEDTKGKKDKKWEPLIKDELAGAMGVYRKLGQYLGIADKGKRLEQFCQQSISKTDPIRTHFVVDVISGTSAGGINGMFLAKALVRDQSMTGLKQLWLREGDLGKLLNDKRSMKGVLGFKLKQPQESLLNSQRMYYKLVEALDRMDDTNNRRPEGEDSPLVGELDLFITTTDIDGIPLPIGLFDKVVYERRHKNVFHFRYSTEDSTGTNRDDFVKANDPFLAFAARCTSSFPFAFEAMRLCDITDIAKAYKAQPSYSDKSASTRDWDKFFSDYMRNGLFDLDLEARQKSATGQLPGTGTTEQKLAAAEIDLRESFRKRSFGDGGYLDNKPFTYATSMLTRRYADCAVDRKLLYVEPSPEHPALTRQRVEPPDFAENVRAAALDLPRQETIREDIDRLYERNELLERIAVLAKDVDADIEVNKTKPLSGKDFKKQGLRQMVRYYGVTYGAYHRLKIAEVTTLLAELIARAAGHDPSSDATLAIRELVKAWRRKEYDPFLSGDPQGKEDEERTENAFLLKFDIRYDLRRQAFLNRRINQLIEVDKDAQIFLTAVGKSSDWPVQVSITDVLGTEREEFQKELNRIKKEEVALVLKNARSAEEKLLDRNSQIGADFYKAIGQLRIGWPDLEAILDCDPGAAREAEAQKALTKEGCGRDSALSDLAKVIGVGFGAKKTPHRERPPNPTAGAKAARACIDHYRRNFVLYDLVTYAVQYGTGAGEASVVDVFRVSPEDAQMLMKEPADKSEGAKLAGRTLMSFGAFLDESWRRNDMLWGRLDGAERIISALLPNKEDEKLRQELIKEAHRGIINQEIEEERNTAAVCCVLSNALANRVMQEDQGKEVRAFVDAVRTRYRDRFTQTQLERLTTGQRLDRQVPPKQALQYISRSTNITGEMLSGLSGKYQFESGKRASGWMARVGTILWHLIAVAVPQSLASLFFRHWLGLLYFFAFAVIAIGVFLDNNVKFAGWQVLGIVVVIHLTVSGVGSYIRGRKFLKLAKAIAVFVVLALMIIGGFSLIDRYGHISLSQPAELALAGAIALVGTLLLSISGRCPVEQVRPIRK
jgi:patatin-related protein